VQRRSRNREGAAFDAAGAAVADAGATFAAAGAAFATAGALAGGATHAPSNDAINVAHTLAARADG
jgi:hypothetical protein